MIRKNSIRLLVLFGLVLLLSGSKPGAFCQTIVKQGGPVPPNFFINAREMSLYRMINDYRYRYNLPPVPLSKSLSYIAALHAKDLFLHHPDQGSCNFHSWSNKGFWAPFCYPKDENKKSSVWDKPRELTRYPSKAYEIVYWENNPLVTDTIMMVWTTEDYFNSFLLNTGKWQGKPWNAIGIAVYENYACAWFGDVNDPEGVAMVFGTTPVQVPVKDTTRIIKPVVKPAVKPTVKQTARTNKTKPKAGADKADSLAIKPADTLATVPAQSSTVNPSVVSQPKDSIPATYYIIVNSSLPKEAANKLVSSLQAKGYPDAKLLESNGKLRVSIFESTDKAGIMLKLKEVKKIYRDAWLLKRPSNSY